MRTVRQGLRMSLPNHRRSTTGGFKIPKQCNFGYNMCLPLQVGAEGLIFWGREGSLKDPEDKTDREAERWRLGSPGSMFQITTTK